MALSKERTIFLGVLGIAAISLVVDRGFMGNPKSAGAGIIQHVEAVVSAKEAVNVLGDMNASSDLSSIAALVESRFSEDSDAMPSDSVAASDVASFFFPVTDLRAQDQRVVGASRSSETLPKLTAIMPGPDGRGTAILDGHAVRVGTETPGGFELVRVVDRSVLLRRNDREYQLTLPVFGRSNGS